MRASASREFATRGSAGGGFSLGGVLGQFGQPLPVLLGGGDDFHFLPVVGKFFAAIEADNISSGQGCGLGAALRPTDGNGKAIVRVFAPEQCIQQFCNHDPPSIPEPVRRESWVVIERAPLHDDNP